MDEACLNDGGSSSRQPRLLHCIKDIVYLISVTYVCDNRHKLLSLLQRILDIESFILERRWECYINKQNTLKATKKMLLSNDDDSTNGDT